MSIGDLFLHIPPVFFFNALATFQREVLSIFFDLVHDTIEIYMDDFTPYGNDFQEAISNLCKVLNKLIEMNLSLSHEKCDFFKNAGIVLNHLLSKEGIQVDSNKISIINKVLVLKKKGF